MPVGRTIRPMLTPHALAFVRDALPARPASVLEVGAGRGKLAQILRSDGYDVTAIDPAARPDTGVTPVALLDVTGTFDAAVAMLSLHHIDPLEQSCAHLASVLVPGAPLVIDEFDIARLDAEAVGWWMTRRGDADGHEHGTPEEIVSNMQSHLHGFDDIVSALEPHFEVATPFRCGYLHRWKLDGELHDEEERLIADGRLPATGVRTVATRT
jgi:SAM-dependent methyltransferase